MESERKLYRYDRYTASSIRAEDRSQSKNLDREEEAEQNSGNPLAININPKLITPHSVRNQIPKSAENKENQKWKKHQFRVNIF